MTTPRTFFSKVTDEYGGEYPQAVVVIRDWSVSSQETYKSIDGVTPYDINSNVSGLAYKLSYHYNQDTRAQGKKLRPLYFEEGEGTSDVFEVDLTNQEVINILDGEGDVFDKQLRAIEADFIIRSN